MKSRTPKAAGQAMIEFALLSGLLLVLLLGIFDFGRAVAIYVSIAEASHEGARQLVLRSNENSSPPDTVIINATLAKIGGGGMVLTEDPCLPNCATPDTATAPTTANTGYIWLTPNRKPGNQEVTVKITYLFSPLTGLISNMTGASLMMTASSSMRAEF